MDHREYDSLRDKVFLTKETFMEASKSDDANLLYVLAEDVRRGYFGYVNIGLSSELARKALDLGPRPFNKRRCYGLLIENAMLSGSPYMDIVKEALDDGVIPESPVRRSESELDFIRSQSAGVNDYGSILQFCWSRRYRADPYWVNRAMEALKANTPAGESPKYPTRDLSTLSLFDAGEEYGYKLLSMVYDRLSEDEESDSLGVSLYYLHEALENIKGKREEKLLIRSATKGYWEAQEEVLLRYPNAESSLKRQYEAAINESISNGRMNYRNIEWYGFNPYSVLPRSSIRAAVNHLNEGIIHGKIKKDGDEAVGMYIAIAKSMFAYRDREAFRYAIRCPMLRICPMLYSMLIDGFGTEKDEDTAKEVAKAYDDNDDEKLKAILGKLRGKKQ